MDGKLFDALATALATPGPRRTMMRGALAGGLASALAFAGVREQADAKHHKHHKKSIAFIISNTLVGGSPAGDPCKSAINCAAGLVCAGTKKAKTCQKCGGGNAACADATKCCLVGACVAQGAVSVCV